MPRIRQNITTGEWAVVAPERAKRPEEFAVRPFSSRVLHADTCNFCVGGDTWKSRLPKLDTKHIYVMPNKYPAFTPEVTLEETGHDFYTDDSSVGAHEVIVLTNPSDSPDHITTATMTELLRVMQNRTRFYEADSNIQAFTPIYNYGHEAGASVAHPHAQFFATALMPPRLSRELFLTEQYFHRHSKCVFCNMAAFELKQNERIIFKNAGAIAFTAYAPRFPFETWILPTDHCADFSAASMTSIQNTAEVLRLTLQRLIKKLNFPAFNWYIHTARFLDHHHEPSYHWHIEIMPRLTTYGGYELATDMIIETVLPEVAARFLRD